MCLSSSIDENSAALDALFTDCADFVHRKFPVGKDKEATLYVGYIDMLVDRDFIEQNVIQRLMLQIWIKAPDAERLKENMFDALKDGGITTADLKESDSMDEIALAILSGDSVLMMEGFTKAIILSTRNWPNRGVQSAETEVVVQGSKEAFSEVIRINTMLIRRRIRDTRLKVKQIQTGRRSATDVALLYLDDVVRPEVLKEALARIERVDIDAVIDSGQLGQFMDDNWLSPFPQEQITERPDKAAAAILEGRIVIIVDNSPFALIIPSTLNVFYQSSEDYYQGFLIMSFVRLIRYVAGFLAVALPGLYIAVAVYHPSMIPMLLIFKMAGARQSVPFPAVAEILLMDMAFELLREAGIRLPGAVGGTIGIVGGLIIGQAAVEAGLVSPIVVIVAAAAGISTFAIPHISLASGFRAVKYLILALSATLGLFGFWMGFLLVLIHLSSLKSYGFPYLFPYVSSELNEYNDLRDSVFRFPLFTMKKRPLFANPSQTSRLHMKNDGETRKE